MTFLEWIFWIALLLGLYPFFFYPLLVTALGGVLRREVCSDAAYQPNVTVLTAAFNEARHIGESVRNKLEQDYPADRLEVIVVSDESSDGTDAIVQQLAAEYPGRVRLLRQSPRQGKTSGLNLAMPHARGEIIVFADANSIYRPDAVARLVSNFADPGVGYVTGKMVYVNADGSLVGDGCSAFMRYENSLRAAETRLGSVVGVDGGVDAVRKDLYRPMRADQLPDFVLPLTVVGEHRRAVYDPRALLTEETLSTHASEYKMRVRVALRALWALRDKRGLMNPLRYGLFSWQLVSHKLLRYLSFAPLAVAAVAGAILARAGGIYPLVLAGEVLFVLLALGAARGPGFVRNFPLARYCFYFLLLNVASAVACGRFLRGQKQVLWQPRVG